MLKKVIWIGAALIVVMAGYVAYFMISSRGLSPEAVAEHSDVRLSITVTYCQPFKKGRLIFGEEEDGALVPFGKKWRTGANAATEIEISKDVTLSGSLLKAGRYSLYTIPGPNQWTVVFNSKLGYWGAGLSDPFDETKDVLRVQAEVVEHDAEIEQFTISFTPADSVVNMNFFWNKTRVIIPMLPID